MKTPGKYRSGREGILFLPLLVLFLAAPLPGAGEEYRNASDGILSMRYSDGRLSLETRDAPLGKVLQELARLAEVNIVSDGPMEDRVTVYMNGLPTDAAAKKILKGKGLSFIYRPLAPGDAAGDYRLEEIRIYVSQGSSGKAQTFSYDKGSTSSSRPRTDRQAAIRERNARRAESRARARTRQDHTPRDDAGSEADQFLSGLLGGNLEALDEVADRLRAENPEARAQIDQFLETLEEAKARAAESGNEVPSLENMGSMGAVMQQMLGGRNR